VNAETPDCEFYRQVTRVIEDREVRRDRQRAMPQRRPVPYCTHKHSPQTLATARLLLTPAAALKCGGILARCPLSEERFRDV